MASKKDIDELSRKLKDMTAVLESIEKQSNAVITVCEMEAEHSLAIIDMLKNSRESTSNEISGLKRELIGEFTYTNDLLKALIDNSNIHVQSCIINYDIANQKLDAILKSILEASENVIQRNNIETKEHIATITESISTIVNAFDEQGKYNDMRLKQIETLSAKLFEAVKIIWLNNLVEDLNIINTNIGGENGKV